MPLIRLANVVDIPAGSTREARLDGATYAICNTGGQFYVVSGDCPHRDGPLGHGALHGHTLVCPWHAWEFDIRTGDCDVGPDCRIGTYPVKIDDGGIYIEVR